MRSSSTSRDFVGGRGALSSRIGSVVGWCPAASAGASAGCPARINRGDELAARAGADDRLDEIDGATSSIDEVRFAGVSSGTTSSTGVASSTPGMTGVQLIVAA